MPYRVEVPAGGDTLDRLIELGALDVDAIDGGRLAALLPDRVDLAQAARVLEAPGLRALAAHGRDDDSVWILRPRPLEIGPLRIVPASAGAAAGPRDILLADLPAFGTGLHPTTRLCLEILPGLASADVTSMLDVGTGSGVLALAALRLGVPRGTAIDIEPAAVAAAAANARLNGLQTRLELVAGGPSVLAGTWPMVAANILAAPLIELAPALSRRVAHRGSLLLSGIRAELRDDVVRTYRRTGFAEGETREREGWAALVMRATW